MHFIRLTLLCVALFSFAPLQAASTLDKKAWRSDLDLLFRTLESNYAYRDQKRVDWPKLKQAAYAKTKDARTIQTFIRILEEVMDATYDPHNMLNVNLKDSWRPVPHDVWADEVGPRIEIKQVRQDSAATRAGVKPGQILRKINGIDVATAIQLRLPRFLFLPDPAARHWALLSVLGGARDTPRVWEVEEQGASKIIRMLEESGKENHEIRAQRLTPGIGLIQIPDFTREDQVKAFDRALDDFKETKALILDVRNNTGGDTIFAKPMLGRFILSTKPYAWMGHIKQGQLIGSSREIIEPRGPWTYNGRVLVLINRFSVSMAEGFAMALQGMGRAELVGSRTAGLGAAIERYELPASHISWQISREPVFQLNGAPREQLLPDHEVEDRAESDAALRKALELIGS